MKIAIMQPYLFPYIGYWQLINMVDEFILLDDVNYIKRGWINRNRISLDGKEKFIVKPILKVSQNKKINELEFLQDDKIANNLSATLKYAYRKSDEWQAVSAVIDEILYYPEQKVNEFLENEIRRICQLLDIKTKISRASSYRPYIHTKGQDGILSLCKILGCDVYINPIGGKKLYEKEAFRQSNIQLYFINTDFDQLLKINESTRWDYSILEIFAENNIEAIKKALLCANLE